MKGFDTVIVTCPACGQEVKFKSQSGYCKGLTYKADCVPKVVADGILYTTVDCPKCGNGVQALDSSPRNLIKIYGKTTEPKGGIPW